MKKIISVLFFLMLISSITYAESYQQRNHNPSTTYPATNPTQINPRYIFNPVLASFESFIITPLQVEAGQTIHFKLKLVGRNDLEVELFYIIPGEELFFLTHLINEGQGLYSGTYLVPVVPTGFYTDFRAIASNDEGEIELFTVTLPGVEVIPTPALSVTLTPPEVTIGDSLLFTVDVIGFDATSVETFYLANDTRIPLASLTKQTENSTDTQIFKGEFPIPSGVPASQYDQFFAEAIDANSEKLQTPFNQTVTLNTDCATVNVTVSDNSLNEPLPGATITVAGKTATTDTSGQASITQLIDNTEQMLFVTAADFLPLEHPKPIILNCLTEVNETVALEPTIKDCAQLNVTVVDDSEATLPIPGASVSVASHIDTTDDNGEASFKGLIEGSQTINVSADNFFTALPKDVELSCDAVTNETISLTSKECATLQVEVVNDSGEGIPEAKVSIASNTDSTDIEGLVTFENILEGTHTVNVTASGFGADEKAVELLCDTPVSESFILDICAEVDVIVSGSDGARLSDVAVNISEFSATTDANGIASFTQLSPGIHSYQVSRSGLESVTNSFLLQECRTSPDEVFPPLNVILDTDCATAQVKVVNDSGEGIPNAEVSIASITGFTNSEGLVTLQNILEGTHTINVSASGYGFPIGEVPPAVLTCDNENVLPNIILDICQQVDFLVLFNSEGGRIPLSGAQVDISGFSVITLDNGIARFPFLNPGTHNYQVSLSQFIPETGSVEINECRTSPNEKFPVTPVELLFDFQNTPK